MAGIWMSMSRINCTNKGGVLFRSSAKAMVGNVDVIVQKSERILKRYWADRNESGRSDNAVRSRLAAPNERADCWSLA
ncbi:hypothetical protein CONLIGDRAFT_147614 [Coniochaeta ligniaria NRRL 30616]|uniref:Uncharacterized protein n=1 Tax=Coniochaeta ligniaria NRRL 30616 TaxID=1408157 RepID=A0A1J7J0P6_9PEZI|nr:hypothetical protein CONLIGDRAFT_147614 [Coniochaeta ligniaria NRRL 30616]